MSASAVPASKMTPAQQNQLARNLIFGQAKPIFQRVTQRAFGSVVQGQNSMSVNPLQVGFLRRFVVEITATISNTGSTTITLSPNGADNLLSNMTFNDFTGNPRHNCSGRSLSYVEAAKYKRIPGAALTSDTVSGFKSIVASNVAPATIASGATGTVTRVFEIPIMVDTGHYMAGGLWLGVNNQSTLLNLALNTAPVVASGGDPLNAIYTGGAGSITAATVSVYQDYWNNVPVNQSNGQPILPVQDVSTAYMITETNTGLTFSSGQPSSWNFPTFSKLLGTYFTYDNGADALNAGTDISQIALVVSNYSIIKQYDPNVIDRLTRDVVGSSFPSGQYAITSRMHPLDVSQYPSLQLQITPSGTVNSGTYSLITTELLRPVQYLAAASGVGGA